MLAKKGKRSPTGRAKGSGKLKLKKDTLKDLDPKSAKVKGGGGGTGVRTCLTCSCAGQEGCTFLKG